MWNALKRSISSMHTLYHVAEVSSLRVTHIQVLPTRLQAAEWQTGFSRHYSVTSDSFVHVAKSSGLELDKPHIDKGIASQDSLLSTDQQEEAWLELGDLEVDEEVHDELKGISLEKGITGVFDIEELVAILHREKLTNIVTIAIPTELYFVDYMVITTGKSPKQMAAIAEFIRKIFKRRATASDSLPVIEGKDNKDWIAMDLGNIALHIFSAKTRQIYDLETLWTCGAKYDDMSQETEDPFAAFKSEFQTSYNQ